MNDLVSLFRNFIYRDLAFILGGSIVLLSALHAFGISLHRLQDQPYTLFLLTVLAYVVGYAVQDFGALLPGRPTSTGYVLRPGRLSRFLYWRGCSILSAVIWLAKGIFNPSGVIDWIAVGFLPIFGLALICLGWVKALQEMQFYEAVKAVIEESGS